MSNLINETKLTGIINGSPELNGVIQSGEIMTGSIAIVGAEEVYQGRHTVIPRIYSQTLPTKNKLVKEDVLVLEIPYYETSNLSGKTVYIGGE